jgi:CO/xanthine dehydrogenase FAD-binding subunit
MGLPKFSYIKPKNLKEASALLIEYGDTARVMAGGTDLLIRLRHCAITPQYVIGLSGLKELESIHYSNESGLVIGALARLNQVAEHADVRERFPALAHAASITATVQIRNMGTVVGNICNAAPSADTATPLLAYDAEVVVVHPGGERTIPIDSFFRGPGLTALEAGELVKELRITVPPRSAGSDYQKLSARSKVDIAAVGVSALVVPDDQGRLARVRIAMGAVAPVPLRAHRAEKILENQAPSDELVRESARAAADECSPISDVRADGAYRRRMVEVLAERALKNSIQMAEENKAGCEA